jgi:hypothetical protein
MAAYVRLSGPDAISALGGPDNWLVRAGGDASGLKSSHRGILRPRPPDNKLSAPPQGLNPKAN